MRTRNFAICAAAILSVLCLLTVTNATLPFEGTWAQVGIASFFATSVNMFTGSFNVPPPPVDRNFFAVVAKLESITVTEGIATILTWNHTISAYTLQLYYSVNGYDSTYSNSIVVHPGDEITFFEEWNYQQSAWTVGANVTDTDQYLFLSFPEDLTLGLASVEILTTLTFNESWPACTRLPRSDLFMVNSIGSNCGFVGCGPWITDSWGLCQSNVLAHGSEAIFSFNATSTDLAANNNNSNADDEVVSLKLSEGKEIAAVPLKKKYI
eukprot:TRINITY_DN8126_c0_g1_i1.p2 TRINITY_DN8126_c0_g1~~TRINITY_DN8126_c0_g1_i1.p2  ORF type:complete len:267 (+),score=50.14 TRINITY_DN8126_c0_g1_i1:182-982(+)